MSRTPKVILLVLEGLWGGGRPLWLTVGTRTLVAEVLTRVSSPGGQPPPQHQDPAPPNSLQAPVLERLSLNTMINILSKLLYTRQPEMPRTMIFCVKILHCSCISFHFSFCSLQLCCISFHTMLLKAEVLIPVLAHQGSYYSVSFLMSGIILIIFL